MDKYYYDLYASHVSKIKEINNNKLEQNSKIEFDDTIQSLLYIQRFFKTTLVKLVNNKLLSFLSLALAIITTQIIFFYDEINTYPIGLDWLSLISLVFGCFILIHSIYISYKISKKIKNSAIFKLVISQIVLFFIVCLLILYCFFCLAPKLYFLLLYISFFMGLFFNFVIHSKITAISHNFYIKSVLKANKVKSKLINRLLKI
jgi:hypothetical protein